MNREPSYCMTHFQLLGPIARKAMGTSVSVVKTGHFLSGSDSTRNVLHRVEPGNDIGFTPPLRLRKTLRAAVLNGGSKHEPPP